VVLEQQVFQPNLLRSLGGHDGCVARSLKVDSGCAAATAAAGAGGGAWETGKHAGDVILIAWIFMLEVSFILLWWV